MAYAAAVGFEGDGGLEAKRSVGPWRRAHEELVALAATRAGLDLAEGRGLLRALRTGVHRELGYASFNEYAERLFGYSARCTQEKLRVAEALEGLPDMARELESAGISFSAVRELTRVAVPATERAWLDAARGRTVRQVEALVSGHRPGNRPGDVPDPRVKRHVIRLEVSGETLATFRDAIAEIRRTAGEALEDDAALLQLCRGVLAGTRDERRSSYQMALTVCERCGDGKQQGRGELVAVAREVVEMAECDAQHIGQVDTRSDLAVGRDDGHAAAHDGAHVGSRKRISRARATQTVPPALRRGVLRRDEGRCRVPGCRHATFVDVHHLELRSEGGANTLDNLVTLCGADHRAIHAGRLSSKGTPSQGLTFRHADGTLYGGSPAAANVELRTKVYRALVRLGFRELEAKQTLAKVVSQSSSSCERLLRAALRELDTKRN